MQEKGSGRKNTRKGNKEDKLMTGRQEGMWKGKEEKGMIKQGRREQLINV